LRNVYDIFQERGFIEQVSDANMVRERLSAPITCYIGFDPTAKSLHVGSLLPIMSLAHMQREGHRPIVVVGGGTSLVGDPSGRDQVRPVMTREEINSNAEGIKRQLSRFIDFSDGKALMLNNADWLASLNYIDFLRDIGRHFSVNRMLAAESYRQRLETGLSFLEFNYMLLQAYDFWYLSKNYDCPLQMGGNDQWGNILAGADLTRRIEGKIIHALTFPLITTADGSKMGKTQKGAVWLDPELTSPYEYYQYWVRSKIYLGSKMRIYERPKIFWHMRPRKYVMARMQRIRPEVQLENYLDKRMTKTLKEFLLISWQETIWARGLRPIFFFMTQIYATQGVKQGG